MRRSRARLAGVALLLGASLGLSGCFGLSVQKEVTNGTSQGPFTVEITCSDGDSNTLTFNGPSTILSAFDSPNTCTVTETASAGATGVSFACVPPIPPGVGCQSTAGGVIVTVPFDFEDEIGVRVINDFAPPTTPPPTDPGAPAAPVVGQPRFTG